MTTRINTTITAIVSALNSAPAVCSHIDRVRLRPVAQSVDLAIAVRPVQSEVQQYLIAGMPVSWITTISVECYARSGASTPADMAVDALLESVYSRLMADPTLSGVVADLQPKGISYDFDVDGEQSTCASLVFNALYRNAGVTLS
jgi:hypothetical protein